MGTHTTPHFLRPVHSDSHAPQPAPSRTVVPGIVPPPDRHSLALAVVAYGVTLLTVLGLTWLQIFGQISTGGTP